MPLPHAIMGIGGCTFIQLNIIVGVASSHDVYAPLLNVINYYWDSFDITAV
jgi:hypothetical protein